jgi:cysteine desulfurase
MDAEGLLHILDLKGIAVSTGAACNSKEAVLSHVLRAIQLPVLTARL